MEDGEYKVNGKNNNKKVTIEAIIDMENGFGEQKVEIKGGRCAEGTVSGRLGRVDMERNSSHGKQF